MVEQRIFSRSAELRTKFVEQYGGIIGQVQLSQSSEPAVDTYAHHEWVMAQEAVGELQKEDPRIFDIASRLATPVDERLREKSEKIDATTRNARFRTGINQIHDSYIAATFSDQDAELRLQYGNNIGSYKGAAEMYPHPVITEGSYLDHE